jgi:hypothetical protein
MDEERFRELDRKRHEEGLSHEEANELGRMLAERENKPYENADGNIDRDDTPRAWEEAAKQEEESGELPEGDSPDEEKQPEDDRPAGRPAGSGYVPPKGTPE